MRAFASTYVQRARPAVRAMRRLRLAPADAETQLLQLLDELLLLLDSDDQVPVRAHVEQANDGGLQVIVDLVDASDVTGTGAIPKAVSLSGLSIDHREGRTRCRCLVDL